MTVDAARLGVRVAQPIQKALRNDFVRHGALVFGATMLMNILNYAFNFAISRRIGVEGYAALSALLSLLMILSAPATVVNLIVVKYAAELHAAGDEGRLWRLCQVFLKCTSAVAILLVVVSLSLRATVASFLRIPPDGALVVCVAIMALGFIMPSVRGVLQGRQDFKRFSISITIESGLKMALGVSLVYAGFGIIGAVSGWLCGTVIALAYSVWAVGHGRAKELRPVNLSLDLRRLFRTTVGVSVATIALTLFSFMDVVLVKHYFGAHEAGLYAAVNLSGKVVLFLVGFLPLIMLPKAIQKAQRGEPALPILVKAAVATICFAGAVLLVFRLAPALVIAVLAGHAFVAAAPYVFEYGIVMAISACLTLLVNYKIGLHRFDFVLPLVIVLIAEVGAIALFHTTLWDVIHILLAGNALSVLACSYRLTSAVPVRLPVVTEAAA